MKAERGRGELLGLAQRASHAVLWNVLLVPSLAVLTLLGSAVVARQLSVEEYGLYGLATATVASLLLWSDLGLSSTVARFTPELERMGRETARRFLRSAASVRIAALGIVVVGLLAARAFEPVSKALPFHGASLALLVLIAGIQSVSRIEQYFLTGLLDRKTIGTILLVVGFVQPILVILTVVRGLGLLGILGAFAVSSLLELLLLSRHALRRARDWSVAGDGKPGPAFRSDAVRFAFVTFLEKMASYLDSPSFVIFLIAAAGAGSQEVAMFAVAGEFALRVVSLLAIPFAGITLPVFSTLEAQGRGEESATALRLHVIVLMLLFVPAAALLTSLSGSLVPLLFSARYSGAVPVLAVLVPFLFLEYTVYSALLAALMTRRKYAQVLMSKLPVLVALPIIVFVIPRWGAVGAAAVLGLTRLASAGILLACGVREFRFRFPVGFAFKVAAAAASSALVVSFFPGAGTADWKLLIAAVAAGAIVFVAVYKGAGGMATPDRDMLLSGAPNEARLLRYVL